MKRLILLILSSSFFLSCNSSKDEIKASVKIGNQVWMSTNLNVDIYRNGDIIPQVTDPTAWAELTTGAWCYYNNDSLKGAIYGKLYNWYAVNDPRGLAPKGWHIPTDEEWITLVNSLGGDTVAGGKMKSTGTWWSASESYNADSLPCSLWELFRDGSLVRLRDSKESSFSVRCLRD